MKRIILTSICALGLFAAKAQSTAPIRKGFSIGGSFGVGVLHFTKGAGDAETGGDISLPNLKIGWLFNDKLGVYLNAPGQMYQQNSRDRSFEGLIPAVQYWPANKWWISGGMGLAMDMPAFYDVVDFGEEEFNFGKGVLISTGYEVLQRRKWTIDLQGRLLMSSVNLDAGKREGTSLTLALGFNFY
jgi:hypothetical protein